jgi:hypothetical protein
VIAARRQQGKGIEEQAMAKDEREVTDYDRATDYGDAVVDQPSRVLVAQADKAVNPKNRGTVGAAKSKRKRTVRILFFDPNGLLTSKKDLRIEFGKRVERDLNNLEADALGPDYLSKTLKLTFKVTYHSRNTTKKERAGFSKLDYPMYFLDGHSNAKTEASEILEIMKDHKIGGGGRGAEQYEQAEEGWESKPVEGLGIQPLSGYRKVGFIKVDQVFDTSTDFETAFANIVKHELGHMFGKSRHGTGVMAAGILGNDSSLDYVDGDQLLILNELGRLISSSQDTLDAQYERQTK